MRRLLLTLIVLAVLGAAGFYALTVPDVIAEQDLPAHTASVENGAYLFNAAGCTSCHARPDAKGDDKLVLAGGLRLETDFGTFVAPNVSPDPEHGIGNWSDLDFVNAMMRGTAPDGSHYYPAFPYTAYQRMTVTDVIDLKAYMDTLPPVAESAPPHELGFPFNIRRSLGLWKRLYLDGQPLATDPSWNAQLARGAYLVEGPGHCGECHSPRNLIGGIDRARAYSGAANPDGEGTIPNITPHETGIGDWSADDIVYALQSGFTPEFDSFGGSMVSVQENMAKLSQEDLEAIAAYLKSLPPLPSSAPQS